MAQKPEIADLGTCFKQAAQQYPEHRAIVCQNRTTIFESLDRMSDAFAAHLTSRGLRKGDRVGLYSPNSDAFVVAYLGIVKSGCTVVPVNLLLNPKEIAFILSDAEARGLVYADVLANAVKTVLESVPSLNTLVAIGDQNPLRHTAFMEMLKPIRETWTPPALQPWEDLAAILYTSGTTGRPKGAMLTHGNIAVNVKSVHEALRFHPGKDIVICVLPMFHAFAATAAMLAPLFAGCTIVPLPRFEPEAVARAIADNQATIFMGVPSMYTLLLRLPDDYAPMFASLRFGISGGAALPVEVMRRFEERFGKLIYEGDGPTECSPVTCVNPIGGERKAASVGRPVPHVEMKIMDDAGRELPRGQIGEICVRGPNVMRGYWRLAEDTAQAFFGEWFRTGDLGYEDDDGYFFIVDRKKDMIIVNGMNVYPRIVEEALYRHPAVREAAVVGEPHELHGEIPIAYVSFQAGKSATSGELREFCLQNLGRHEAPRRFVFMEDLPKNAAGKIMKRELHKHGELERGIDLR
jgi:long-chain acyl-CoA synthetase